MSIQTELDRLQTAKADLKTALQDKGVTVLDATTLDGYGALVAQITAGGDPWQVVQAVSLPKTPPTVEGAAVYAPPAVNYGYLSVEVPEGRTAIEISQFWGGFLNYAVLALTKEVLYGNVSPFSMDSRQGQTVVLQINVTGVNEIYYRVTDVPF